MTANRRHVLQMLGATLAGAALPAWAAFPDKPVKITVGFAAGGAADIVARQLGAKVSEQVGQQYIVENRPGATGTIAATSVAHSPADGYTMMLASQSTMLVAPAIYPKLQFDPVKDFTPVTLLVTMPMLLVVSSSLPVKNVKELIAMAKSDKAPLSYASAGSGGPQHVAGELFALMAKLQLSHVPYKGEAPAFTDVIGGQVPFMWANLPAAMPLVQTGKLRALAISTGKRHPSYPDIPTMAEAGDLPDFDVVSWYGLFAPAGTPKDVVATLNKQAVAAVKSKELSAKLSEQGFTPVGNSAEEFGGFVKTEVPRWGKLIKEANIRAE